MDDDAGVDRDATDGDDGAAVVIRTAAPLGAAVAGRVHRDRLATPAPPPGVKEDAVVGLAPTAAAAAGLVAPMTRTPRGGAKAAGPPQRVAEE